MSVVLLIMTALEIACLVLVVRLYRKVQDMEGSKMAIPRGEAIRSAPVSPAVDLSGVDLSAVMGIVSDVMARHADESGEEVAQVSPQDVASVVAAMGKGADGA